MELITRERIVAEEWDRLLEQRRYWPPDTPGCAFHALAALGRTPTPDEFDAAFREAGNPGMNSLVGCHECGRNVGVVVQLGEPWDDESRTVHVCRDCLLKALVLSGTDGCTSARGEAIPDNGDGVR